MSRRRSERGIASRFTRALGALFGALPAIVPISVIALAGGTGTGAQPPPSGTSSSGAPAPSSSAAPATVDSASAPLVYVAPVDSIIHPISAEFIGDAIDTADAHGAAVIILVLETPGGLVESTRTIIARMVAARTPVVVYVGPGAARAASAGFLITLAADVAVMAPAAHIGAAHPVSGTGENVGETMQQKIASDIAAYARSLANTRKRNVGLAEEAVVKSRAFTADEALKASPPLIDFIARDLDDLVTQLDGRSVTRFDGRQVTLHTAHARRESLEMTARQRFLSTLAHPQIAYILFTLGLLGLTVEMWNPGSVFPGVAGGLCLLLAFLAFQVVPINTAGLLLIVFGLFLLILEIKIPSFGVLGVGGALSLILGSLIMMDRSEDIRVSLQVIVPAMLALAGIFLFLGRLALAAQRLPSVTGASGMIGTIGRALTAIPPRDVGRVSAHGEIWNARTTAAATTSISNGEPVRIVAVEGLMLTVESASPAGTSARETPAGTVQSEPLPHSSAAHADDARGDASRSDAAHSDAAQAAPVRPMA